MAAIPVPSVNTPTYQTWGAAVANKLNAVVVKTFTKTIAAGPAIVITAAELGLPSVQGAAGDIDYGTATVALGLFDVSNSAQVTIRPYTVSGVPALGFASAGWTAHVRIIAWGPAALTVDDPELRPGDGDRPEATPQ